MKNIKRHTAFILLALLPVLWHCNRTTDNGQTATPEVRVKATAVRQGNITRALTFNGTTLYLKKNSIVSPVAGYITQVNTSFGARVEKNATVFEMITKEDKALQDANTSGRPISAMHIKAPATGIITNLSISETGTYVGEGTTLATIAQNKDLAIQAHIPFQYSHLARRGTTCRMILPGGESLPGRVAQQLPEVSPADQTQKILIRPDKNISLPENLNLRVQFTAGAHDSTILVPNAALLTNETQTRWWVMKIGDSSRAIREMVKKGFSNDSLTEILNSGLKVNDSVIYDGAYGLRDSTIVKVVR